MKTSFNQNNQAEKDKRIASESKKAASKTYFQAVGRRRESSAQVRLYPLSGSKKISLYGKDLKSGDFIVNKKSAEIYFPGEVSKQAYRAPLRATQTLNDFAVSVVVRGGGKQGQLGATIHGIARALDAVNTEEYHSVLKKDGFLTRDPRVKERRKAGFAQKARARKSSPKR